MTDEVRRDFVIGREHRENYSSMRAFERIVDVSVLALSGRVPLLGTAPEVASHTVGASAVPRLALGYINKA